MFIGVRRVLEFASAWWPTLHRELPANFGTGFDALLPGAALIAGAVFRGLFVVAVLALAGAFLGAELRARWLRLLLFFAVAGSLVFSWGSRADFLKQFLAGSILLALTIVGIQQLVRLNILGLLLIAVCTALLGPAVEFLAQPDALYRRNAYLLLFAIIVLLTWPLVNWRIAGNTAKE